MRRPEDRVRWVAHGIALLRDRGIPANPHNARLYRDLAWFFQHKIGGDDDSAHLAYKLVLATGMALRAYHDSGDFDPSETVTDSRLIGRSVWNTEWMLVIPGGTLLSDPNSGLEAFAASVSDIKLLFQTYAYSGN